MFLRLPLHRWPSFRVTLEVYMQAHLLWFGSLSRPSGIRWLFIYHRLWQTKSPFICTSGGTSFVWSIVIPEAAARWRRQWETNEAKDSDSLGSYANKGNSPTAAIQRNSCELSATRALKCYCKWALHDATLSTSLSKVKDQFKVAVINACIAPFNETFINVLWHLL